MKMILVALATLVSVNVFATNPSDGVSCSLTYLSTDKFTAGETVDGGWTATGKSIQDAYKFFNLKVTKVVNKSKAVYWKLDLTSVKTGELEFSVTSPDSRGFQYTIPVDNISNPDESAEDPPVYNRLQVNCEAVVFAG